MILRQIVVSRKLPYYILLFFLAITHLESGAKPEICNEGADFCDQIQLETKKKGLHLQLERFL